LTARPIYDPVPGSPYQPGDTVQIVDAIDTDVYDVSGHIDREGRVEYLEYSCGCGQRYPHDPMIGVKFADDKIEEFWAEELGPLSNGFPEALILLTNQNPID
jgi:hypothetical protein